MELRIVTPQCYWPFIADGSHVCLNADETFVVDEHRERRRPRSDHSAGRVRLRESYDADTSTHWW
jgi:hypothetical protein